MTRKVRKEIRWALGRTQILLVRNACHHETFYGVLNRVDVRALRTLASFAEKGLTAAETRYLASTRYPLKPT